MATDPVCYAIIDEETAEHKATYRDTGYYFCCQWCKKKFEEDPVRYSRHSQDATTDLASLR